MKKAFILLGLIPAIATAAHAERDQKLSDQIERAAHEKTEGGRRQDCPFERIRLLTELQHNRMNAVARYNLGVIYRDFYDFKNEALREFELFVRLSSNSGPEYAKVVRKVIPDLRAKIARSAEERLNANSRNQIKASALLAEGSALEAKHDAVSAMKKYEAALVEDPLADLAALAIARLKGRNARSEKDVYGVLAMYRMAIDLNPGKQASYREAATFAYQHQRWNSTVAILDRALANFPASGEFLDMMIAALTKLEHIELAEAWRRFRLSIAAAGGGKNAQQSTDKILKSRENSLKQREKNLSIREKHLRAMSLASGIDGGNHDKKEEYELFCDIASHESDKGLGEEERECVGNALCAIGVYYREGIPGVLPKDLSKAFDYYSRAAKFGHPVAQCNLGMCYENGDCVAKDLWKSIQWYGKALEAGFEKAKSGIERIKRTPGVTTEYVVRSGDMFTLIARKHGTTVRVLRALNGLKPDDHIRVGQNLLCRRQATTSRKCVRVKDKGPTSGMRK